MTVTNKVPYYESLTFLLSCLLLLSCSTQKTSNTPTSLPNIIIVFADDMGYGDSPSYHKDSKIPTPYLDQLCLVNGIWALQWALKDKSKAPLKIMGFNYRFKDDGIDFTQPLTAGFDYYFGTDVPNYPPWRARRRLYVLKRFTIHFQVFLPCAKAIENSYPGN